MHPRLVAKPFAPAVHVVIPTHTTRHLACCLASIALQRVLPATVVLTCDTDSPELAGLLDEFWPVVQGSMGGRRPPVFAHVFRPHQGKAMLNQTRNNGLRALERIATLDDRDIVLVVDGDTLLAPDAVARHAELAIHGYELAIPYRVNLDEATTERISAQAVLDAAAGGMLDPLVGQPNSEELFWRHRRYRRQLLLRRVLPAWTGVNKSHKPKVLGGHHAVSVRRLRAVNGYDELYTAYGFDDDDLSRRLHALRPPPRTAIAVKDILAYHLWHPTRAPRRPTDAPGYERFAQELPTVAEHGWQNPLPQPPPVVRIVGSAASAETALSAAS